MSTTNNVTHGVTLNYGHLTHSLTGRVCVTGCVKGQCIATNGHEINKETSQRPRPLLIGPFRQLMAHAAGGPSAGHCTASCTDASFLRRPTGASWSVPGRRPTLAVRCISHRFVQLAGSLPTKCSVHFINFTRVGHSELSQVSETTHRWRIVQDLRCAIHPRRPHLFACYANGPSLRPKVDRCCSIGPGGIIDHQWPELWKILFRSNGKKCLWCPPGGQFIKFARHFYSAGREKRKKKLATSGRPVADEIVMDGPSPVTHTRWCKWYQMCAS